MSNNKGGKKPAQKKPKKKMSHKARRELFIRIVAFVLMAALLMSLIIIITAHDHEADASSYSSEASISQRLSEINSEKTTLNKRLDEIATEQASAEEEVALIMDQILLLDQEYAYQSVLMERNHETLVSMQNDLAAAQDQGNALYAQLKGLLRAAEESQRPSFWSVLFGSADMQEVVSRITMVNDVMNYIKDQLNSYDELQTEIAEQKYDVQMQETKYLELQQELSQTKTELTERNTYLTSRLAELSTEYDDVSERLSYMAPVINLSDYDYKFTQPLSETEKNELLTQAMDELVAAGVSEYEMDCRLGILDAGLDLVGYVPYFWGGRVYSPGWCDLWNSLQPIKHTGCEGYQPVGEYFPYGLDCGGFVFWAAMTMYGVDSWDSPVEWMADKGARSMFEAAESVEWEDKMPGDLVVNTPVTHIGYYLCTDANGKPLYLHCCGNYGVVVSGSVLCNFDRAAQIEF